MRLEGCWIWDTTDLLVQGLMKVTDGKWESSPGRQGTGVAS